MTYRDKDSIQPALGHYPDANGSTTVNEAYGGKQKKLAALDPTEIQRRKSKEGQQRKLKRRIIVYMRDKWTCVECHTHLHDLPEGVRLTLDHIRPTSKGGSNEIENLQTMCSTCNEKKDNTWDGISGSASSGWNRKKE